MSSRAVLRRVGENKAGESAEPEIVISSWIDESDFCLKMYDIIALLKGEEGLFAKISNETFNIADGTAQIRVLYSPRLRLKRMSCVNHAKKESNTIMAREYNRDHRDTILWKKIPKDYKIIGLCGFKQTQGGQALHLADFQIWKPPKDWLSY